MYSNILSQTLYAAAYHDDYAFIGQHGVPSTLTATTVSGFPIDATIGRGMQTGAATAVLGSGGVTGYTYSAMYYDSRHRVAQVRATDHTGGTEDVSTAYSFTDAVDTVRAEVGVGYGSNFTANTVYTYDKGRKTRMTVSVSHGRPAVSRLTEYAYDAVGRLTGRQRQLTGTGRSACSYSYDVHGWPTAIDNGTFQERLYYADGLDGGCWNGNISTVKWKTDGSTYGPLGKAVSITEGSARLTLSYGPDRQRWRSRSARKWRTDTLTVETLYDGDYEHVTMEDGTVREFHYLGHGLVCVVTDGGSPLVLYALTDNVGSYVQMADPLGQTRFRADYDVWGRQTVTANAVDFQRGYGGHEMLSRFALVNMDGRLYDPNLGRFLSPDNYVQAPDDSQSFNRYSYCLNNPLKYTDPTGEVWWVPIVVGAVIGSAVSGASYAISTWVTGGKWKAGDFWKSVGMGAFSGALSAGIGQVASGIGVSQVFANKIGYKLLSQTANAVVTNTVFGNDMDWSDMAGVAASSLFASALPDYKAQKGSAFGNFIRETAHNTALGATSGLVQGATKSLIKGDARYVYEGALGGALSGFSRTLALNALMGAPFEVEKELRDLSEDGIIRKGGLVGAFTRLFHLTGDSPFSSKSGNGIALGSNAYSDIGHILTNAHEFYHLMDIENMGWSRFYATWLMEWLGIYKSTSPTLEQQADNYAYDYYYRLTGHK